MTSYLYLSLGGHSPLIDLMSSSAMGRLLNYFYVNRKPIGSICHGPTVFASLSLVSATWPLKGKKMTVFSDNEEKFNEVTWNATLGYYPQDILTNLGGSVSVTAVPFVSHVVTDGLLVTGQNPQSAPDFGQAFLSVLQANN